MPQANMFGDMIKGGRAASEEALAHDEPVDRTDLLRTIDNQAAMIEQLQVDKRKLLKFLEVKRVEDAEARYGR